MSAYDDFLDKISPGLVLALIIFLVIVFLSGCASTLLVNSGESQVEIIRNGYGKIICIDGLCATIKKAPCRGDGCN